MRLSAPFFRSRYYKKALPALNRITVARKTYGIYMNSSSTCLYKQVPKHFHSPALDYETCSVNVYYFVVHYKFLTTSDFS